VNWLDEALYELEYADEPIVGSCRTKVFGRKARLVRRIEAWNDESARLFAADCAEDVLPIFEREYPDDDRPRKAIEAARAYARGEIDAAARAAEAAAEAAEAAAEAARDRYSTMLVARLGLDGDGGAE
jgi:hypothetical protein